MNIFQKGVVRTNIDIYVFILIRQQIVQDDIYAIEM